MRMDRISVHTYQSWVRTRLWAATQVNSCMKWNTLTSLTLMVLPIIKAHMVVAELSFAWSHTFVFPAFFDVAELAPDQRLTIATMITTFINENRLRTGGVPLNNPVKPRYFLTKSAPKVGQTYPV